LDLDILKHIG